MNTDSPPAEIAFRLVAFLVTGFVGLILLTILTLIGLMIVPEATPRPDPDSMAAAVNFANRAAMIILFSLPISWLFISGLPQKRSGQNLGMRLFGLKVVDRTQERLTWGKILARAIILGVLNLSCIGILLHLAVALDRQRRTLWDRLSGTTVVPVPTKLASVNLRRQRREKWSKD